MKVNLLGTTASAAVEPAMFGMPQPTGALNFFDILVDGLSDKISSWQRH